MERERPSTCKYFLLHGFYGLSLVVRLASLGSSTWWFGGVIRCSLALVSSSATVETHSGRVHWAISIVIYGTADLTNAFYNQGCDESM
jgi:hypothetical protein